MTEEEEEEEEQEHENKRIRPRERALGQKCIMTLVRAIEEICSCMKSP